MVIDDTPYSRRTMMVHGARVSMMIGTLVVVMIFPRWRLMVNLPSMLMD